MSAETVYSVGCTATSIPAARAVSAVIGPIAAALSPRAASALIISQKFVTELELVNATRSIVPAVIILRTRSTGAFVGFTVLYTGATTTSRAPAAASISGK